MRLVDEDGPFGADAAYAAYYAQEVDGQLMQPTGGAQVEHDDSDDTDYVVLENVNGVLAVVMLIGKGSHDEAYIVEQDQWPADILRDHMDPETFEEQFGVDA